MSLVMEYLPHGSLIGYLEKNQYKVNTQRLLLFASQICKVRVGDTSQNVDETRHKNSGHVRDHSYGKHQN